MEIKIHEEEEPHRNNESPIPLDRYKISYLVFHPKDCSKYVRAYQILYAHDKEHAEKKAGVHYKLIFKIVKL